MNFAVRTVKKVKGEASVPGDKSISHRALIVGALVDGEFEIENCNPGDDCLTTISCLKKLNVKIDRPSDTSVVVHGKGLEGFAEPYDILDAGESATTLRLLAGLLSACPFVSIINGSDSLKRRPVKRVIEPLRLMGAQIYARQDDQYPPVFIKGGKLSGIEYQIPVPSAQVKSAILLAGLYANDRTTIIEKIKTRDHTERLLKYLGAKIDVGENMTIYPGSVLKPKKIFIPGDISSASFFITAGVLLRDSEVRIRNAGLNPTRTGFLDVIWKMNAIVSMDVSDKWEFEPYADITAISSEIKPIELGPEDIPSVIDELPLIALLATQADGTSIIRGAQELRVKESDRIKSIVSNLQKMGADITETEDGFVVKGPCKLRATTVNSFGDHRIAMMLAIAGLIAEGETVIEDFECVSKSFPDFAEQLHRLLKGEF